MNASWSRQTPNIDGGPSATSGARGWKLRPSFRPRDLLAVAAALALLGISSHRVGLDAAALETPEAAGKGWTFLAQAFPVRLERAQRIERMIQLGRMRGPDTPPPDPSDPRAVAEYDAMIDPQRLPWLARIEDRPLRPREPDSPREPYYVEPLGYVQQCLGLMVETLEMALWGTLLCLALSVPLGLAAARNYAPHPWIYAAARGVCSFVRAIPELIVALFLVVMYGPGPVAGILALGFHTSGFLGKFFADDIENADPGPQQALRSTGGNAIQVLRLAVVPQVLPQYVAYIQYIFERNVRTATILGVVGAGGIGFELMARFQNGEYDMVATILLLVFATVIVLEHISQRIRTRLI